MILKFYAGLLAAAVLAFAGPARAESVPDKPPVQPADDEDESELHNEVKLVCYVTLAELTEKGETPEIAGTLITKDGKTANLRLSNPKKMRPRIEKLAGAKITLIGEFQKKDSVFLAHDILEKDTVRTEPPAGPPEGL